jgi:hypothetical protein
MKFYLPSSRWIFGDITGRGDVIGGDTVSKIQDAVSVADILDGFDLNILLVN